MKEVNLASLSQAYQKLEESLFDKYLQYHKLKVKKDELNDLLILLEEFNNVCVDIYAHNSFYFGFEIPQISKEFDLLRFGEDYIINLELKNDSTKSKVLKQLTSNRYYLDYLGQQVFCFCFIAKTKKFYYLDDTDNLNEVSCEDVFSAIENQKIKRVENIYTIFTPSKFLISPFNSTDNFINNRYFLTGQQTEYKEKILNYLNSKGPTFISICGFAGTGKTLLTYDVAKKVMLDGKRVLIIHCGALNTGHELLNSKYKWKIIPIKEVKATSVLRLSNYDLIIIDETQRIYPSQLELIIDVVRKKGSKCIFSYDQEQCLRRTEINNNISKSITHKTSSVTFTLSKKIRANSDLSYFVDFLFDKKYKICSIPMAKVEINYFDNYKDAKQYLELLNENEWKIINFTPSRVNNYPYDNLSIAYEDNAHRVIGQEYDNVVAVIDSYFYYKSNKLSTQGYKERPYYHPTRMLYQIMSRARESLNVVIINNPVILERCLSILS